MALPSLLGALIAFGVVIGPAYSLAMEKEDGTLLRHRAVPDGLVGYFSGQMLLQSLSLVPQLIVILVPSFLLFDGLMAHPNGWFTVLWVIVLGLLAALPIGMIIGALVPGVQKVGMWGMLPIMVLAGISGIFYPVQQLWGWVQVVAQVFPMYWMGLGMRSAFLPDAALVNEIGESWRTLETVLVLGCVGRGRRRRDTDRAASDGAQADRLAGRGRSRGHHAVGQVSPQSEGVHNRIALLRVEQGVSRRELADALGVHYQTVGYLERGEYNPSLHLALRIAEFFGVPVDVIFSIQPFPRVSDMTNSA